MLYRKRISEGHRFEARRLDRIEIRGLWMSSQLVACCGIGGRVSYLMPTPAAISTTRFASSTLMPGGGQTKLPPTLTAKRA